MSRVELRAEPCLDTMVKRPKPKRAAAGSGEAVVEETRNLGFSRGREVHPEAGSHEHVNHAHQCSSAAAP